MKALNWIGVGLLVLVFSISVIRRVASYIGDDQSDVVHIRIAHRTLHTGVRQAFDEIVSRYNELNPNVRVSITEVPQTMWVMWIRTRFSGDNAPDIFEGGHISDEEIARNCLPLTGELELPNRYNQGTDLEGIPWRKTFINDLADSVNYNERLYDYYSVPTHFNTPRCFYNKALYRKILGHEEPPETYDEFIHNCEAIKEYARTHSVAIAPLASSKMHFQWMLETIRLQMTQRLALDTNWRKDWTFTPLDAVEAFLDGDWRNSEQPMRSLWQVTEEIGRYFQPGFLSVERDQATLLFLQQKAVMTYSASWDAHTLLTTTDFETGAFRLPLPGASHPLYGQAVMGPTSEADIPLSGNFCINRRSEHQDAALDFLRFLTSQKANRIYADLSFRLPAVRGVSPPAVVKAFEPQLEGAPRGFNLDYKEFGYGLSERALQENLFRLFEAEPDAVDSFVQALDRTLEEVLSRDSQRLLVQSKANRKRQDILLTALFAEDSPETRKLIGTLSEQRVTQQIRDIISMESIGEK